MGELGITVIEDVRNHPTNFGRVEKHYKDQYMQPLIFYVNQNLVAN